EAGPDLPGGSEGIEEPSPAVLPLRIAPFAQVERHAGHGPPQLISQIRILPLDLLDQRLDPTDHVERDGIDRKRHTNLSLSPNRGPSPRPARGGRCKGAALRAAPRAAGRRNCLARMREAIPSTASTARPCASRARGYAEETRESAPT